MAHNGFPEIILEHHFTNLYVMKWILLFSALIASLAKVIVNALIAY